MQPKCCDKQNKLKYNQESHLCFKLENYKKYHQELITGKNKLFDENQDSSNKKENNKFPKKENSNNFTENSSQKFDTELISQKYKYYRTHPLKVCIGPSFIHRNGLFAIDVIKKDDIVIEYVGEIITNKIADYREKEYNGKGFGDCYMFRIDGDSIIDGTKYGNLARFINHSCCPNCRAEANEINGEKHILLYANKDIKINEEITYDYKFESESEKIQCRCGAPNCRGRLN